MKICEVCGKEYTPKSNFNQCKYCSNECRAVVRAEVVKRQNAKISEKLKNRDHTKICPICKEPFESWHNETYCSASCKKHAQRRRCYNMSIDTEVRRKKKPKEIKTLDDLMEIFKAEGKTPYDYSEWKKQKSLEKVEKIKV